MNLMVDNWVLMFSDFQHARRAVRSDICGWQEVVPLPAQVQGLTILTVLRPFYEKFVVEQTGSKCRIHVCSCSL